MASVTLNGRTIDLAKALPLQIKDWKALKRNGVTPRDLQAGAEVEQIAALVHHVLAKADPSVTVEEVDDLAFGDPVLKVVMKALEEAGKEKPDRPS